MNNNSKYVQQIEPNLSLSQKYENHIKIMNQIYIDKTEVKQNYARICEAYKNVAQKKCRNHLNLRIFRTQNDRKINITRNALVPTNYFLENSSISPKSKLPLLQLKEQMKNAEDAKSNLQYSRRLNITEK